MALLVGQRLLLVAAPPVANGSMPRRRNFVRRSTVASLRPKTEASRGRTRRTTQAVAAPLEQATVTEPPKVLIKGGKGKATHLKKGEIIKVINTHGTQVVDFWAFCTGEGLWGKELFSIHHTRNALQKLTPQAGDVLRTASMEPILTFLEDTGPGVHDTTAAACSYGLYALHLGAEAAKEHDSCTNNLYEALKELNLELAEDPRFGYNTPCPLNLWMAVADEPDETGFIYVPVGPEQKAGDYCTFRAEQDCVIAMSACPWDLSLMNGVECGGKPQDVEFQVFKN